MPTRVQPVDWIMIAVDVGMLAKVGIPGNEAPDLGVIVACSHLHQSGIPIVAVAACGGKHVGITATASRAYRVTKTIVIDCACHRLAGAGYCPLAAQPVKERILSVFAEQNGSVVVSGCSRRALLFQQERSACILEIGGRASCGSADPSSQDIIREAGGVAALGDRGQLTIIVEAEAVSRAGKCAASLFSIGIVAIGVRDASASAG